jgi:hypothetical protein
MEDMIVDRRKLGHRPCGNAGWKAAACVHDRQSQTELYEVQHEFPTASFNCDLPLHTSSLQHLNNHVAMGASGRGHNEHGSSKVVQAQ